MINSTIFGAANQELTNLHLEGFRRALLRAYDYTSKLALDEPAFATPNKQFLSGMMRYGAVDFFLEQAVARGEIPGFTVEWIPLNGSGGVYALELSSQTVSVIAHHLQDADEPPRDSNLRFEKREGNQILLPGFNEASQQTGKVNLTLVHGNKDAEFAFFRAYTNPGDLREYQELGGNLMHSDTPTELEEVVEEVKLELKGTEVNAARKAQ